MSLWQRAFRFYAVGAAGATLQLLIVAVLAHAFRVHYGVATAMALGATLVHNFIWHVRWTWRDRRPGTGYVVAFVRFASANGGVSILGTALLVPLCVERFGLPAVAANVVAIAVCGLVNFWLASRVFRCGREKGPGVISSRNYARPHF